MCFRDSHQILLYDLLKITRIRPLITSVHTSGKIDWGNSWNSVVPILFLFATSQLLKGTVFFYHQHTYFVYVCIKYSKKKKTKSGETYVNPI